MGSGSNEGLPTAKGKAHPLRNGVATALAMILGLVLVAVLFLYNRQINQVDERLLGTWKSDADLTIAEHKKIHPITEDLEATLRLFFGRLQVTYSQGRYTERMDGFSDEGWYQVVAKDAQSVIIRRPPRPPMGSELLKIHFIDPDTFWVFVNEEAMSREFFRRVRS